MSGTGAGHEWDISDVMVTGTVHVQQGTGYEQDTSYEQGTLGYSRVQAKTKVQQGTDYKQGTLGLQVFLRRFAFMLRFGYTL